MKDIRPIRVFWYQSIGFLVIIALSWIDECVGLHQLVLGDHPYLADYRESTLEMLLILGVWLIVAGATRRILAHMRHLDSFMKVCAWCRRIRHNGRWMPLEEFFEQGFDARTSHGICLECLEKRKVEIECAGRGKADSPPLERPDAPPEPLAKREP